MYIVFNERSVDEFFSHIDNIQQAREAFNDFVLFLKDLKSKDICEGIIICNGEKLYGMPVVKGYCLKDWFRDEQVNKTYKQFLSSYLGTKCTYVEISDYCDEFKISIAGREYLCEGGTVAAATKSPITSVLSSEFWRQDKIKGLHLHMNEDTEMLSAEREVENWTRLTNLDIVEESRRRTLFEGISSGQDLWEKRTVIFPNLEFCENVKAQLYADPERFHTVKIMERLQILQDYFSRNNTMYDVKELGINARTESDSVKENPSLNQYRRFRIPSGEEKFFFDHISFTGKYTGGRIYFYPCIKENKCYIGYIGRHLPTKKF